MSLEFNDDNFESEVISSDVPVLVDFSATWCGPCKMLTPIIEELAEENAGKVKIGKVDIDQAQNTAAKYGIMSVPTVIYFKGGEVVGSAQGVQPKGVYQQKIDELA